MKQPARHWAYQSVAKTSNSNISNSNRSELDKLAAEIRDELDNLGVRVAELEKYIDKTGHKEKNIINGYIFRLFGILTFRELF